MGAVALVVMVLLVVTVVTHDSTLPDPEEACWAAYDSARSLADTNRIDMRFVRGSQVGQDDARRCRDVRTNFAAARRHEERAASGRSKVPR